MSQKVKGIVQKLQQTEIAENELIELFQQILILSINDSNIINEYDLLEAVGILFKKSLNSQIKKLCGAALADFGHLIIKNTDFQSLLGISTSFASDEVVSNIGKITLINLLEKIEHLINGQIRASLADHIIQQIGKSFQTAIYSSSSNFLSQTVALNILTILEKILTQNTDIMSKEKLNQILDKLKIDGEQNEIWMKIQALLQSQKDRLKANQERKLDLNDEINILKQKLEQEEQQKQISEKQKQITEQQLIQSEQRAQVAEKKMEEHKQEMEDFLRFINSSLEVSETGVSDWIEMKSILELEEVGTDEQKEDILRRKIKVCQKIIGVFIGNQNSDKMIYVIEMGVVTSLLRFIDSQQLDKIQIYHIWAFFVFTCASNNQICLHLFNLNPFPTLVRLLDHSDSLVINKVVLSIFNIIIPGSNLTETASVHPYYESLEVVDGIQKLFDLYSRISNEEDKDAIVESIGNIYRAQEIPNDDMKKQIVSHLKQILMRVGDDQKAHAQIALSYLVQNSENLTEIKKGIDIDQIANNLKLNVDENQISFDCWIIIALLENRADDELRKRIIDSGYVRDLLIQFLTNDQESITLPHVHSFYVLTTPISEEVLQLLYSAKPYPALVKLLNHNDCQIVDYIVASIYSILTNTQGSLNSQELTQTVHPHFVDMQACGGVQKLFSLFQRNLNKYSRDHSAICVGALYGNKEITDRNIRREIISYLKLLQSDYHDQLKYIANSTLIDLGKNEVNRVEIEREGTIISSDLISQSIYSTYSSTNNNLNQSIFYIESEKLQQLQQNSLNSTSNLNFQPSLKNYVDQSKISIQNYNNLQPEFQINNEFNLFLCGIDGMV